MAEPQVAKVCFSQLDGGQVVGDTIGWTGVGRVWLLIQAVLGGTRLTVRDLLELQEGTVLPLDVQVGGPARVRVNGLPLAEGEVVVINDAFGVRLSRLAIEPTAQKDEQRVGGKS
ncbi:MAG TPA: FliM/FliN family flagellar motor switch protein [Firmicutes bacterium]|jgi:flagellar motor switch protein FliN/FliY|nr:FliM/FliN family flagellar motor switch protein [Bacillota bacterium]